VSAFGLTLLEGAVGTKGLVPRDEFVDKDKISLDLSESQTLAVLCDEFVSDAVSSRQQIAEGRQFQTCRCFHSESPHCDWLECEVKCSDGLAEAYIRFGPKDVMQPTEECFKFNSLMLLNLPIRWADFARTTG
jgi:hypothetical protein